jgi:acetyl esterase/lipase
MEIPVSKPAGRILIRVYTPEGPGPFPVHLNFHGGMANLNSQSWSPALTFWLSILEFRRMGSWKSQF